MKLGFWPRSAVMALLCAGAASAKPGVGATTFCARYPTAPACVGGQPACTYCHTSAPEKNDFGKGLEAKMPPASNPRPLSDSDFATALQGALIAIEAADSDADGVSNLIEIQKGTLPRRRHQPELRGLQVRPPVHLPEAAARLLRQLAHL